MNQPELDDHTRAVLDRLRHSIAPLSVYEMPSDLAEAAVWEIGKIVLEDRHLPLVQYNTYRWYLRELSKVLRTRTGWSLALELEIALRKWVAYQLDLGLLQVLLCECCDRIGAMSTKDIEESPKYETRMTIEARSPNVEPRRHEGQEDGVKTAKDAKNAKAEPDSTTKTQRHHPEQMTNDEVPMTNETRSPSASNDERCTSNETTTEGGGNG